VTTFEAVYRDGALHPATPLPLPDGTAVRVSVEPLTPTSPPDACDVLARILASAAKASKDVPVENVSGNVDRYLYGGPGDPGDVR
jgi:predicted DNA-binding antitoxin AbrB/MazE fold protein